MIATFSLKNETKTEAPVRQEVFNLKDSEAQEIFFKVTDVNQNFEKCFENEDDIRVQGQKWFKELNSCFHKSFKKIRISRKSKNVKKVDIDELFDVRRKLVNQIKSTRDKIKTND